MRRLSRVVPNRDWGTGDSLLGCGVGYGLLHRIPKPQDRVLPLSAKVHTDGRQGAAAPPDLDEAELETSQDYDATEGVSLVDTSGTESPKLQNRTLNRAKSPSPLQPTRALPSAARPPPISPSSRSNRHRNSIAGTLVEEED
jgi:hypothetical protein